MQTYFAIWLGGTLLDDHGGGGKGNEPTLLPHKSDS